MNRDIEKHRIEIECWIETDPTGIIKRVTVISG
jgi:hypothetical protein